jgi:hypothetical protein
VAFVKIIAVAVAIGLVITVALVALGLFVQGYRWARAVIRATQAIGLTGRRRRAPSTEYHPERTVTRELHGIVETELVPDATSTLLDYARCFYFGESVVRHLLAGCAALGLMTTGALAAPDCSSTADEIDPRCYGALSGNDDGPALQQAINAAVKADLPLHLIHAHYVTREPLIIDYGTGPSKGQEGFLLKSDGATIDGTGAGNVNVLTVSCGGGTEAAPKGCFYFHQEGTLFVNANGSAFAFVLGAGGLADAQNSVSIDHLSVNNSGTGGGAWLNYVLSSKINIIANAAGDWPGLTMVQVQMSTIQISASSPTSALWIVNLYNFGDVLTSPDFENSAYCVISWGSPAHDITIVGGQFDCDNAFYDPQGTVKASGYNLSSRVTAYTAP